MMARRDKDHVVHNARRGFPQRSHAAEAALLGPALLPQTDPWPRSTKAQWRKTGSPSPHQTIQGPDGPVALAVGRN